MVGGAQWPAPGVGVSAGPHVGPAPSSRRTVPSHKAGFWDKGGFWFEIPLVRKDSEKRNLGAPITGKLVILQGVIKAWSPLQPRTVDGQCPAAPALTWLALDPPFKDDSHDTPNQLATPAT